MAHSIGMLSLTDRVCLLVAPEDARRDRLQGALEVAGYGVRSCSSSAGALITLESGGAVAATIVSQELGAAAVSDVLARAAPASVPVVVLGASSADSALDAASEGAADFVAAPIEAKAVLGRLQQLLQRRSAPSVALEELGASMGILGASGAVRRLLSVIRKISRFRTNVLLLGESGTGKELVARALHACGPHSQQLFVPLNCAALGRDIIENELFGHERGAFTGANERKRGLFELADGGTLFLDEIGEMELSTQSKLLRVLEGNEFRRVGGTGKIKVDVSVIAATNLDLDEAVKAGRFREDLYYRLKVVTVVVPTLRERKDDIPLLAAQFLRDFNRRNLTELEGVDPRAMERLQAYDWPGNVRELKHVIESAAILAESEVIGPADLQLGLESPTAATSEDVLELPLGLTLPEVERRWIEAALGRHATRAEAARSLGIGLRTLYTKLREYGLDRAADDLTT